MVISVIHVAEYDVQSRGMNLSPSYGGCMTHLGGWEPCCRQIIKIVFLIYLFLTFYQYERPWKDSLIKRGF